MQWVPNQSHNQNCKTALGSCPPAEQGCNQQGMWEIERRSQGKGTHRSGGYAQAGDRGRTHTQVG